jgi:hypothetical protein
MELDSRSHIPLTNFRMAGKGTFRQSPSGRIKVPAILSANAFSHAE